MKTSEIKQLSEDELRQRYADAARQYRVIAAGNDVFGAEQQAAVIEQIYQELKSRGKNPQNSLLSLLDHDDPAVLRWAAAHALKFAPGMGKPVLEKLATKSLGFLSGDAQTVLREWQKTHKSGG